MMRLPPFQYVAPESLEQACRFMEEYGSESKLMAGGTDLVPSLKLGNLAPRHIVNLSAIPHLDEIGFDERSGLHLGALVKLHSLEKSPVILEKYPAIAQAATCVGSPQLREMGTVGGNLNIETRCLYYNQPDFWRAFRPTCIKMGGDTCNAIGGGRKCFAVFSGDLAPVMIALGARATLVSAQGERNVAVKELYTGNGAKPLSMKPEEILIGIDLPAPEKGTSSSYSKFAVRKAIDFPLASVATLVTLDGEEKVCRAARVVIGAVGTRPEEVEGIGELLEEKRLTYELIEEAARLAFKAARPIANRGSSPSYRKRMIEVLLRRALSSALSDTELGKEHMR
ncbi:MAG: aerobic-type carbon monoxide dehydrogenase, middle subunit CoxM/CutM-like protein [Deltaproteobacteria bacterium]|jgi:4-hydroxybenzoyl-CoA reductase subunit beta|nr:aerobic-type carbon monoxide dehydrogenase, middle subunit CoxM/CutM-like protein [Deltaproteobacteria bacterium]